MKKFKPMLAEDAILDRLRFPLYASPKLDGIRASVLKEGPRTRSLKAIPNRHVQAQNWGPLWGLDGEFTVGPPTDPKVYSTTESAIMTMSGEPEFTFYVFDYVPFITDDPNTPFESRMLLLRDSKRYLESFPFIKILEHKLIETMEQLEQYEQEQLELGYEGIMTRAPKGVYKYGRSTAKTEQYLLKVKRFKHDEAEIIGFQEKLHNANEAVINALGYTERSSHMANKVPLDTLGALECRDLKTGVEFKIGTGFDDEQRKRIWDNRETELGRVVKYKHFPIGVKDKPRFPVFEGYRSSVDMGEPV